MSILLNTILRCWVDFRLECAKRWQQSLDPDLDHSEWRDEEVSIIVAHKLQVGSSLILFRIAFSLRQHSSLVGIGKTYKGNIFQAAPRTLSKIGSCSRNSSRHTLTIFKLHRPRAKIPEPRYHTSQSCKLAIGVKLNSSSIHR